MSHVLYKQKLWKKWRWNTFTCALFFENVPFYVCSNKMRRRFNHHKSCNFPWCADAISQRRHHNRLLELGFWLISSDLRDLCLTAPPRKFMHSISFSPSLSLRLTEETESEALCSFDSQLPQARSFSSVPRNTCSVVRHKWPIAGSVCGSRSLGLSEATKR